MAIALHRLHVKSVRERAPQESTASSEIESAGERERERALLCAAACLPGATAAAAAVLLLRRHLQDQGVVSMLLALLSSYAYAVNIRLCPTFC